MKYVSFSSFKKIGFSGLALLLFLLSMDACKSTNKAVAQKSGAALWAQKCQSCHNAPAPNNFSPQQWNVIIYHMRIKANLTNQEADKIVDFLKGQ